MRNLKQHLPEPCRNGFRPGNGRKPFRTKGTERADAELKTASAGAVQERFQAGKRKETVPDKGNGEGRCGT